MWSNAVKKAYEKNKPLKDIETIEMFITELETLPIPRTEKTTREILKYIAQHSEMALNKLWERDALDWELPNAKNFGKFMFLYGIFQRRMKLLNDYLAKAPGLTTRHDFIFLLYVRFRI